MDSFKILSVIRKEWRLALSRMLFCIALSEIFLRNSVFSRSIILISFIELLTFSRNLSCSKDALHVWLLTHKTIYKKVPEWPPNSSNGRKISYLDEFNSLKYVFVTILWGLKISTSKTTMVPIMVVEIESFRTPKIAAKPLKPYIKMFYSLQ